MVVRECVEIVVKIELLTEHFVEEWWVPVRVENAVLFAVEFECCHWKRPRFHSER